MIMEETKRFAGVWGRSRFLPSWVLGSLMVLLGVMVSSAGAGVGDWATFTNANVIQDIQMVGDELWCATSGGVLQLQTEDGFIRKHTNVDGLGFIDVLSLSVDDLGKLWFGTNGGGVSTRDPASGRWRTYTEFDGVAGKVVAAVEVYGNRIWVGTEKGISHFVWNEVEGDYFWKENYLAEHGVPVKQVRAFLDYGDEIWVGMEGGVARARYRHPDFVPNLQDPASWTTYDVSQGLADNQVNCLALVDSMVWAGTDRGVSVFQDSIWVSRSSGLPLNTVVHDLLVDDYLVWAGTASGLYTYNSLSVPPIEWIPVMEGETMSALAMDSAGVLWVGTDGGGIMKALGEDWTRYLTEGPAGNNIEEVILDHQEHVWVSTIAPGYVAKANRLAEGRWTVFDEADGLETGQGLPSLFVDHLGRKWFGSWGDGVGVLDDAGTLTKEDDIWLHLDEENSGLKGVPQNPRYVVVAGIAQDEQNNYWFLNYSGVESGLVVCDPALSEWTVYSVRDGLVFPEVQALAIDQEGIKWVGARQEGMSRFDDAGTPFDKMDDDSLFAWQTYSESSSDLYRLIVSDNVTSICVDGEGIVWIGTAAGIMRFSSFYFTSVIGLLNESVNVIVADARNNIWVGTDGGASFLDTDGDVWTHFTMANSGLVSDRVRDIAINERTGEVWLATDLGLSRYESGIISPVSSMEGVSVFPNPYFPERGDGLAIFSGLADGSTVYIFNLAGELVRELPMPANNLNQVAWDGKNAQGSDVASGVYIFMVHNEVGLSKTGKLALIR
jgi:ligand-binding sensor domain-containing protein